MLAFHKRDPSCLREWSDVLLSVVVFLLHLDWGGEVVGSGCCLGALPDRLHIMLASHQLQLYGYHAGRDDMH